MATTNKILYGTSNQAFTLTAASLGSNAARQSTEVDNTTNLYDEVGVSGKVKTNAAGTSTAGFCIIYAYATTNGGTNRTENAGATDAAITLTVPPNAIRIGSFNTVANATTYNFGPFPVAAYFGGSLPAAWGIILENRSGAALDATGANHGFWYQGYQGQNV